MQWKNEGIVETQGKTGMVQLNSGVPSVQNHFE